MYFLCKMCNVWGTLRSDYASSQVLREIMARLTDNHVFTQNGCRTLLQELQSKIHCNLWTCFNFYSTLQLTKKILGQCIKSILLHLLWLARKDLLQ